MDNYDIQPLVEYLDVKIFDRHRLIIFKEIPMSLEEKLQKISDLEENNHFLGCSFMAKDNRKPILAENAADFVIESIERNIKNLNELDDIPVMGVDS